MTPRAILLVTLLAFAAPARGRADLFTYTYTGTLALSSGADVLGLDGGVFALAYAVDDSVAPLSQVADIGFQTTTYGIQTVGLTLSGTSQDGTYAILNGPDVLELTDVSSGGGGNDSVQTTITPQFSVGAATLTVGQLFAMFHTDGFLSGPLPTSPPAFGTPDTFILNTVGSPDLAAGSSGYNFSGATITTVVTPAVPEPATSGLLVMGALVLLRLRRLPGTGGQSVCSLRGPDSR